MTNITVKKIAKDIVATIASGSIMVGAFASASIVDNGNGHGSDNEVLYEAKELAMSISRWAEKD
jgi:hypothetical protein